jgi:precorrin-2/cobalt-factor-2 C20-methyltransferase
LAEAVSGRLFGIGVGPGDPELMTVKAARLLAQVPVVAYLAPRPGESLARRIAAPYIPPGRTELAIAIEMRPGPEPEAVYDAAAAAIAAHLGAGRDVAVLCEGDPFFYGSFAYLHERLADAFPCMVVPGVASLAACAAAAGRALARRDETLIVLPATLPDAELAARLALGGGVAILKVGRHLPRVAALLAVQGLAERSVYVAQASRGGEVVLPLAECAGVTAPYFSMILVAGADT